MSMAVSPLHSEVGPVVVKGVSGSGKSLIGKGIAEALGLLFIEGDQLHPRANVDKMSAGIALTDDDRWPWLDRVGDELRREAGSNGGAIAACSALKRAYRDRLRGEDGPSLRFVFLAGSRALLAERMGARKHHFMPSSLLDSQLATLEDPIGEPGVATLSVDDTPDRIVTKAVEWLQARTQGH